jgi:3'(2'), 5'-bisphosphate nucleotidase
LTLAGRVPSPVPAALVAPVTEVVRQAGAAILRVYCATECATTLKHDQSPLTEADLASHRLIVQELARLTPGIPVLSEEAADVPFEVRSQWTAYWLVDPLDGTKEFLAKNGEFTVNVALVIDHEAALGVVGVPARDVIYSGVPGVGARRVDGTSPPRAIKTRRPAASVVRVVGSRSHRGDSLTGFLTRIGAHELIPTGSALKFCIVAEGDADVYPRLGPTSEWDTAAAHAVLVAAGGAVVQADGAPLRYNTKSGLLNPSFIAFGDPDRDWVAALADR